MKVFLFFAVVAVVKGTALHYVPAAAVETGDSVQFRSEDNLGNYDFGYQEDHTSGGSFRKEVGDAHGNVAGSYGLRDADGRVRVVNYIANDDGFKADIKTNEPGVEPADPADARINKPGPLVLAADAPVAVAQPVVAQPVAIQSFSSFPAPVAAVKTSTIAVSDPIPAPVAVPVVQPIPYAFPQPAVAVAKTAVVQPAPTLLSVAKTAVAVEQAPVLHTFPAPAAVPVAKGSAVAIEEHVAPATYAFPEPAAFPVAKGNVAVVQPAPYTFPAAVPVAKNSYAVFEPAPVVSKSSVIVEETAPVKYSFPVPAAVPVAKGSLSVPVLAPTSSFSYTTHVVNKAPLHYGVEGPVGYVPAPYGLAGTGFRYPHSPYYGLHSPVVSYAGPVLRFNNILYPGYPVVKK